VLANRYASLEEYFEDVYSLNSSGQDLMLLDIEELFTDSFQDGDDLEEDDENYDDDGYSTKFNDYLV
jgi:hypothetical protein